MNRYSEVELHRWWNPWHRAACLITADDGTFGLGITTHGGPVERIINDHLGPLLVGSDCMATERAWDLMRRASAPHGASSLVSHAISAVDLALWDLKGRLIGLPVYELLGGPQKESISCYASHNDFSYGMEPSLTWFLELGFRAVKVFLRNGTGSGTQGIQRDVEMVAEARAIVGDDVDLMVDGWMSLDVEHTVRLAEALQPYRIRWLEDCLMPDDVAGYRRLRGRLPHVTLASGENWRSIQPFAVAAADGLVDILQPDLSWVGGLTAAVRICHLAESFGLSVITHGGMNTPYGQHLALATPAVTWGERSEGVSPPGVPLDEMSAIPGTVPIRNGFVRPSDAPGFGLEYTLDWLESVTV